MQHPWLFERCKEVEAEPDGYLDLWSREHYKSTIITFGKSIQDILASHGDQPLEKWQGREVTIGIFSHTRPNAKGFLRQIMREFESNELLKEWFPDVLYQEPKKSAPKWSEDDGIIVKRNGNPKESTVEAWGLVDGQPTGKHFVVRAYDDVVTKESVRSPLMMQSTLESWELSLSLGTDGGVERYIGTRYHFNDAYKEIIKREAAIPRLYPATDNGEADGKPVFWDEETLRRKRKIMGSYTFGCQILQNPKADQVQGFKAEQMKFYRDAHHGDGMNKYIIVDPANEKKKKSDWSSFFVIGANSDGKYYVLDMVRDRLNLKERTTKLFELHRDWDPLGVGYEKYGMQSDIEHIEDKMEDENYRFDITPLGGPVGKNERIRGLIPDFEDGNILFPERLSYVNYQQQTVDMVQTFIDEEFIPFPVGEHDDMLDTLARIKDSDMNIEFPKVKKSGSSWATGNGGGSWAA